MKWNSEIFQKTHFMTIWLYSLLDVNSNRVGVRTRTITIGWDLVLWSYGPVVRWSCGPVVLWSCGPTILKRFLDWLCWKKLKFYCICIGIKQDFKTKSQPLPAVLWFCGPAVLRSCGSQKIGRIGHNIIYNILEWMSLIGTLLKIRQ